MESSSSPLPAEVSHCVNIAQLTGFGLGVRRSFKSTSEAAPKEQVSADSHKSPDSALVSSKITPVAVRGEFSATSAQHTGLSQLGELHVTLVILQVAPKQQGIE